MLFLSSAYYCIFGAQGMGILSFEFTDFLVKRCCFFRASSASRLDLDDEVLDLQLELEAVTD